MVIRDIQSGGSQVAEAAIPDGAAKLDAQDDSLVLLQSWSELLEHPESWPEVCLKWAERIDDDEAMARLRPILNNLFGYAAARDGDSIKIFREKMRRAIDNAGRNTFVVDRWGVIGSIGEDAAEFLDFTAGENIKELLLEPLSHLFQELEQANEGSLSEIFGRDGIRRLIDVKYMKPFSGEEEKLRITVCNVFLPAAAERYLRDKLALTNAEVQILSLSIQRHNAESIARKRNNSVSTVRTHIQNITSKLGCKTFNDVMVRTLEIIAYHQKGRPAALDEIGDFIPTQQGAQILKLKKNRGQIEFSIYGNPQLRPLLTLHSMEYGYQPPDEFIALAKQSGFCIYSVRRPGFGLSSTGASIHENAERLEEFLALLNLDNILAVSFSTASPLALKLMHSSKRISQIILVNYGFNLQSEENHIRPNWVKGLLNLYLASQASFNFAFMVTGNLIKLRGFRGFYERLCENCAEDLAYLGQHTDEFEKSAELYRTVDGDTARRELIDNFRQNQDITDMLATYRNVTGLYGEHAYGTPLSSAQRNAAKQNVPFFVIENAGRNCVFQRPKAFFDIVNSFQVADRAKIS